MVMSLWPRFLALPVDTYARCRVLAEMREYAIEITEVRLH